MLLTGVLAGGAVIYGTYAYNKSLNTTQSALEAMRDKMLEKGELTAEDHARLEKYESTYGNSFNNVLLDKVNPNSLIRSNRKSHKIFQKNREKFDKVTEKKNPYVNEAILSEKETGDYVEIESVKPVDTYKVGKYVVSYDYLKETPNYMLSYTNSIFGHMHKGLKGQMEDLRSQNEENVKKDTWEYKLLVESQKDIANSRIVKDNILKGNGFFSKVWRHSTKRFGNHFIAGRALNAHNTIKKRVKRNIALYQADSLKAYRELQTSLLDEKELLDARSEDVVKKFDDIFFADAKEINQDISRKKSREEGEVEKKGSKWVESKLAFDPMQVNLGAVNEKGKLNIIDHNNQKTAESYQSFANLYKQLVVATFNMRQGKSENYATIIKAIRDYGNLMDGNRFEGNLPMCHGFFRTNSMRLAMSAGLAAGTDGTDNLEPAMKKTLDFARVMLMQCLTQVMFEQVNNNPNLFVNLEAFGKLSANYQTAKLAATALMNRVDFQETVEQETKRQAERDDLRLHAGIEYFKKKMHDDLPKTNENEADEEQQKRFNRYDSILDKYFTYKAANDPRFRDTIVSLQKEGANEHTEQYIEKVKETVKDSSGVEITKTRYNLKNVDAIDKSKVLQLNDVYARHLKGQIAGLLTKRELIRRFVAEKCNSQTLGLKALQEQLVDKIEDNLGEEMLLASWWGNMIEGCQEALGHDDHVGKEIADGEKQKGKNAKVHRAFKAPTDQELMSMCVQYFSKAVPNEIMDKEIAARCKAFKDAIRETISQHGGNCVFDVEKLWETDRKIGKILSDKGDDAKQNFEDYLKDLKATLNSNIGTVNERTKIVSNSFVFNCRRNKVFDYIGANLFTGGKQLIESLTDYAIEKIMNESLTDKATETLEKNVSEALDKSVLENRWKISSMLALNAKLLQPGEDPASYTVEKLVALFNEWNDEFTKRSNKITELYQGIYMAPEQIEKEMAFFDEHAWLEDEDFKAAVDAHIKNLTEAGLLKNEKGASDVTIDEFVRAMRDRESIYEAQDVVNLTDLFREEILNNEAYQSVFDSMMSVETLYDLLKKSVKEDDEVAPIVASLNAGEIEKLTVADYSMVRRFIGERLLPLASYLDTLPKEQLTNTVRYKCVERAMKGELDFITPENLVMQERQNINTRKEIGRKRSHILLSQESKEMGTVEVDKSHAEDEKAKKEDVLAARQNRIKTAAHFWKTMWKERPDLAQAISLALRSLDGILVNRRELKEKEHIIDRKEEYSREKFNSDYNEELERFVKKLTGKEDIFTRSEICVAWYKKLPILKQGAKNAKQIDSKKKEQIEKTEFEAPRWGTGNQKILDEAVAPFINQVRDFVAAHKMNPADLAAAYNEMALMGNADILLGVGKKYEETLYKPKDAYEEDLHDMTHHIMGNKYMSLFVYGKALDTPQYEDVKKARELLLGSSGNETLNQRKALFKNVNYLALAIEEAVKSFEPNVELYCKINNENLEKEMKEFREDYAGLKEKSLLFSDALNRFEGNAGKNVNGEVSTEADLLKCYNDFFAEIENCSARLYSLYANYGKFNETHPNEEYKYSLGNEAFILGVRETIANHKEFINGADAIKNIFREIIKDREARFQKYGVEDDEAAFSLYLKTKFTTSDEDKNAVKCYEKNCNKIRANDKKLADKDKMAIFLPVLFQDDRFIELMTQTGEKNDKAIDEYLAQFKQKVAPFLQAIVGPDSKYKFDMTTIVPQFIEHHKDELLKGSEIFVDANDYEQELKFIQNAWMTRTSKGKSAKNIVDAKASGSLAIVAEEKNQIVKAIMREGVVSYQKLTDPDQIEGILKQYKRQWDSNLAIVKEMPVYKKLMVKKLNGSTNKTVADLLCETYADKLITMSQMDLINCMSSFAEHMLEVNESRSIVVDSKGNLDWDYVKERKVKEDIKARQVDGRNALAPGNASIRKAADSYYNGVSILSNAKTHKQDQKLVKADEMEANREKIRRKIETMKKLKSEDVNITDDDLDIMTELYSTGNVWDSFPLLWESNIEEAFEAIRKLRMEVTKAIEEDRKEKKGNTGLTDEIIDHDVNRFILYMAAHGRLNYEGGANGFVIRKAKELWHKVKNYLPGTSQDVKQEFVESKKSYAQMFNDYGQTQSDVDNITAESLNIRGSQFAIDQCNSERLALQMAMFTMDEEQFNALKAERKSLLVSTANIAVAVSEALKSNKLLKQDEKSSEIDALIDVLTRGFIDYYGEDIQKLVPVRKDKDGNEIVWTEEDIQAERKRIVDEIKEKLSGKDAMYYIKAFSEREEAMGKEESTKDGPVTKRTVVSDKEFEAAVNSLGKERAKRFAAMNEGEKKALALIVSQPFRFLATDRVGAINMVMDHDKVIEGYFHKMYHVEQDRSDAAALDIIKLLSGNELENAIDYTGAHERLAGRVGTKGGREIFDQAMELMELCKERIDFYKIREWDNIADPEKSIKLAGLIGKSKANTPEANKLKNSKEVSGMKEALSNMVSSSLQEKLAGVNMHILITLLQNRSILDDSTIKGKEGMPVNALMREQVVKDLCMSNTKRAEYIRNADKQMYINKAIMTLLSFQVRDDVKLENGLLKVQDILETSLNRKTVVDETLLSKAIDMANEISKLLGSLSVEDGNMKLDEFNEKYHGSKVLGGKTKPVKYANDLNGILYKVNAVLKTQASSEEFSVFKNKAGEKALAFRKSLADKWALEYAKRQKEVEKLSEADKAAFAEAKEAIDKMIVPINKNDSEIKTDKFTA